MCFSLIPDTYFMHLLNVYTVHVLDLDTLSFIYPYGYRYDYAHSSKFEYVVSDDDSIISGNCDNSSIRSLLHL